MPDKHDKQPTEAQPTTKQNYFFPPDFSCEAESLEEATKIYEQHTKGRAQDAE